MNDPSRNAQREWQDREDATPRSEFAHQPPIAQIEQDRFCDGCGYNLRTQPIRRDAHTEVLLCRCPECGKFHPAREHTTIGTLWIRRLAIPALWFWLLLIVAASLGIAGGQLATTFICLEELTTWRRAVVPATGNTTGGGALGATPITIGNRRVTFSGNSVTITETTDDSASTATPTQPASTQPAATQPSTTRPDATPIQNTLAIPIVPPAAPAQPITTTTTTTYRREVIEDETRRVATLAIARSISVILGFLFVTFLVVAVHHWRRWAYLVPLLLTVAGAAAIAGIVWWVESPHLFDWALPIILSLVGTYVVGGIVGIFVGRGFGRLVVRILLPPRLRQPLAFLWYADGKTPPGLGLREHAR